MARIAVAGAAGFIGSHVVERLRRSGHQVVAIDRPGADLTIAQDAGAQVHEVDLSNPEAATEVLEGCAGLINATGLFDLGASLEVLTEVNVTLVHRLLAAARSAGVSRVVHLSSVAVYGMPAETPMPESGALRPRGAYEQSKLEGERAAMEHHGAGLEVSVLRPTLVYGPRSRYGQAMLIALASQVAALGKRKFMTLVGGPLGHHVHVEDVALAAELLLFHEDAPGQAFNVADSLPMGIGDSVAAIVEALGMQVGLGLRSPLAWKLMGFISNILPDWVLRRLNARIRKGQSVLAARGMKFEVRPRLDKDWIGYFNGQYVFDTTRLQQLGYEPKYPSFREAIEGVISWYQNSGWIPTPRRIEVPTATALPREET